MRSRKQDALLGCGSATGNSSALHAVICVRIYCRLTNHKGKVRTEQNIVSKWLMSKVPLLHLPLQTCCTLRSIISSPAFTRQYWSPFLRLSSAHCLGFVSHFYALSLHYLAEQSHQIRHLTLLPSYVVAQEKYQIQSNLMGMLRKRQRWGFRRWYTLLLAIQEFGSTPEVSRPSKKTTKVAKNPSLKCLEAFTCHGENLIKAYVHCSCKKIDDSFIAFSGIAKVFYKVIGDEYLAGLWKSPVREGLDWCVHTPQQRISLKYRAPYWSWMSVNEPVTLDLPTSQSKYLVNIFKHDIKRWRSDHVDAGNRRTINCLYNSHNVELDSR